MTCGWSIVLIQVLWFLHQIDRHDITEILLKVALNTIKHHNPNPNPSQESKQLYLCDCVRDVIDDISTDTADGIVTLNDYLIYLILFADDTVLFGKTPEILQHLLENYSYIAGNGISKLTLTKPK